jgi:hypothetical protein
MFNTLIPYTVNFRNYDGTLLQTVKVNVHGAAAEYTGVSPVKPNANELEDWEFIGWDPDNASITGDTDCYAQFKNNASMTRLLITKKISGAYANDRVTTIRESAFRDCRKLTSLDFASVTSIASMAFHTCIELETLVIRSGTACALAGTSAFDSTKIASGTGYIYVPSALLADYQAATNWSTYADQFRTIEDYPDICGGAT